MLNGIGNRAAAAALVGLFTLGGGQARAGLIVVSGDENITDALVGNGTAVNPGNQRFFTNVLGGGTRVDVQGTDSIGVDTPLANINSFYNTIGGVVSTIQSSPVTGSSLSGINLFISAIPASPFSCFGDIGAEYVFRERRLAISLG
jgi:hypothetical protein